MFNLTKKVISLSLGAYLTFSPISVIGEPSKKEWLIEQIMDSRQGVYQKIKYGGVEMHAFLRSPWKHKIKVASAVCPYLPDFNSEEDSEEDKVREFAPKGQKLEQIVSAYEIQSGENVLAAINGSFFNTETYHIVGREVVNGRRIQRKTEFKKDMIAISTVKTNWKPKPGYPDYKNRASLLIDSEGIPKIGYFNDISNADFFLTAGWMLVSEGVNVWERARINEQFDNYHLKSKYRSAIAITGHGNFLMLTTAKTTIDKLSDILMKLGVKSAMCLDSGSSVQMVLDKTYNKTGHIRKDNYLIHGTQRNIVNGIVVVE